MESYPSNVHIRRWFELSIATTLVTRWNVLVVISIIVILVTYIVDLGIDVARKVGWTLGVFLTIVLIGISRGGGH